MTRKNIPADNRLLYWRIPAWGIGGHGSVLGWFILEIQVFHRYYRHLHQMLSYFLALSTFVTWPSCVLNIVMMTDALLICIHKVYSDCNGVRHIMNLPSSSLLPFAKIKHKKVLKFMIIRMHHNNNCLGKSIATNQRSTSKTKPSLSIRQSRNRSPLCTRAGRQCWPIITADPGKRD